ncbi:transformation system protein [Malaciobacter molluscorum]|uniref:type II secretion system F family protein n=1 Tax=Malaciobacter molluscorum TaxID=1032072 RepID=UPI00100BB407|nr:type II secretion system F family protein [Malaciobacter molluscorum]RXJ94855.1 transformation system protein [Malaciobacter molluscorum]
MKYKVVYQKDNKLHSKLVNEDNITFENLPKNSIKIYKRIDFTSIIRKKITNSQIYQLFYELDMMLQANININEALEILYKNRKEITLKRFCKELLDSIKSGKGLNIKYENYIIDKSIKKFFLLINKKGNINIAINTFVKLLQFELKMKNELKKAFSYPFILLLTLFFSFFCIFSFVLPTFETLLNSNSINANIATTLLFSLKNILENNIFLIFSSFLSVIFIITFFYKINTKFEFFIHKIIFTKILFISSLLKSFELYRLFIVINILQKANYEFHDTLNSANSLIKNKYVLDKISLIENLLKSGKTISFACEYSNLFDDIVLNLIQTGEKSNNMSVVTFEIEKIYKKRYENRVKSLSFWIQPFVFILIMGLILWLIVAIFVPMWSMSDMIKY